MVKTIWTLLLLCLALSCPHPVWAQDDEEDPESHTFIIEPEEEEPNHHQRVIEFLWMEQGDLWNDRFRGRVYPRDPIQGQRAKLSLLLRRYRNGKRRGSPKPIKVEIHVRRSDGGDSKVYTFENPPENVIKQDHVFNMHGNYVVSFVSYYAENETYTVAVRFEVRKDRYSGTDDDEDDDD